MKKILTVVLTLALGMSFATVAGAQTTGTKDAHVVGAYTVADMQKSVDVEKVKAMKKIDKVKENKSFKLLHDYGNGNFTFTNAPNVDKDAYLAELSGLSGQGYSKTSSYNLEAYGYDTGGWQYGVTKVGAHNKDSLWFGKGDYTTNDRIIWTGSSDSYYYGLSPVYADKIQQTDTFGCNCVTSSSATFTWGAPSVQFTRNGQTATITWDPVTTPTAYSYNANYGNVMVDCYSISSGSHTTGANYRIGTTSYLANAINLQNF